MNQDEIDELLGSSSDEDMGTKNKNKQKGNQKEKVLHQDEEYNSDFWDEDNDVKKAKDEDKYDDDEFEIEEIEGEEAVKSETEMDQNEIAEESKHTSELDDEVEQSWDNHQNREKDDDLSLAKSEYEESVRVNENKSSQKDDKRGKNLGKKLNEDIKKTGVKNKVNGKQLSNEKKSEKQIRSIKNESENGENNKTKKRSEEEIKEALDKINREKKELYEQKKRKKEKEEKEKKEIYEEAMKKENEKKEKKKEEERKREEKRKQKEHENKSENASTFKSQRNLNQEVENETKDWKETKEKTKKELEDKRKESLQRKKREEKEKQRLLDERHVANLESLKEKKAEETKNAGIKKKEEFLKVKSNLDKAKIKDKQTEGKEQDVLVIKKIKNEIRDLKNENQQKTNKIHEFEKQIESLKLQFKEKEKQLYTGFKKGSQKENKIKTHFTKEEKASDLAPIEKFVSQFVHFDNPEQIFVYLDESGDGVLTIDEIIKGIKKEGVPDKIAEEIQRVLDRDSDGNITLEEFVFNIEAELKKQKDFRDFMGKIDIIDPIDIEAEIIDMRVKIKYMHNEISKLGEESQKVYEEKSQEYLKKIKKIEQLSKKQKPSQNEGVHGDMIAENTKNMLKKEYLTLSNKIEMETKLLKAIQDSLSKNLADKNNTLMARVEENLLMKEKLYQMKNEIQETQLRYLSLKKIEQNKQGYIERMSKERAEREQIYLKAKEYQLRIADPTKEVQNKKYAEDVRFLAAVIMIQRNYRKKKALKEVEMKKNNK